MFEVVVEVLEAETFKVGFPLEVQHCLILSSNQLLIDLILRVLFDSRLHLIAEHQLSTLQVFLALLLLFLAAECCF